MIVRNIMYHLVGRFLGMKIPQTFNPDNYISFDRENASKPNNWPTGTNLFNAVEAEDMLKYVFKDNPVLTEYVKGTTVTPYLYNAKVLKVVDGDTVDVQVDLGFDVSKKIRLRFAGINAPETSTDAGKVAKDFLTTTLPVGSDIIIMSKEYDKYGRSVAVVYYNNISLNELMVSSGHAVIYK